tara:strand:- start:2341 stop:2526 length:186 start_codon:yes stop_codon:yes gene_type:complete
MRRVLKTLEANPKPIDVFNFKPYFSKMISIKGIKVKMEESNKKENKKVTKVRTLPVSFFTG